MARGQTIRLFFALLVVVCPLRCALGGCTDLAPPETTVGDCGNCCLPQPAELPGTPDSVPEDCPCQNCLCQGAVTAPQTGNEDRVDLVVPVPPPNDLPISTAAVTATGLFQPCKPLPVPTTGTAARAVLSCWTL